MRQIARFWLLIGSFTVAALSFGYLSLTFLTFLAPDVALLTTGTSERLFVTGVALGSLAVFIWAFSFIRGPKSEGVPEQDDGESTLGNRNR